MLKYKSILLLLPLTLSLFSCGLGSSSGSESSSSAIDANKISRQFMLANVTKDYTKSETSNSYIVKEYQSDLKWVDILDKDFVTYDIHKNKDDKYGRGVYNRTTGKIVVPAIEDYGGIVKVLNGPRTGTSPLSYFIHSNLIAHHTRFVDDTNTVLCEASPDNFYCGKMKNGKDYYEVLEFKSNKKSRKIFLLKDGDPKKRVELTKDNSMFVVNDSEYGQRFTLGYECGLDDYYFIKKGDFTYLIDKDYNVISKTDLMNIPIFLKYQGFQGKIFFNLALGDVEEAWIYDVLNNTLKKDPKYNNTCKALIYNDDGEKEVITVDKYDGQVFDLSGKSLGYLGYTLIPREIYKISENRYITNYGQIMNENGRIIHRVNTLKPAIVDLALQYIYQYEMPTINFNGATINGKKYQSVSSVNGMYPNWILDIKLPNGTIKELQRHTYLSLYVYQTDSGEYCVYGLDGNQIENYTFVYDNLMYEDEYSHYEFNSLVHGFERPQGGYSYHEIGYDSMLLHYYND